MVKSFTFSMHENKESLDMVDYYLRHDMA